MKKFFYIWCIGLLLAFASCQYYGFYPTHTEKMPHAPSVKTIRNNPAAFRSFSSHGFTGK